MNKAKLSEIISVRLNIECPCCESINGVEISKTEITYKGKTLECSTCGAELYIEPSDIKRLIRSL